MLIGLVAASASAVMFGLAALLQAVGVRTLPKGAEWHTVVRATLHSRRMLTVLAAYILGWAFHLVAIALLPLFLAQSGIAASLVLTAIGASWWLGEGLTRRQWTSILATVIGLALLAVAAGRTGTSEFGDLTTGILVLGTFVVGSLGWWRVRSGGHAAWLGLLAGLAYAGSPVATRALTDPHSDSRTLLVAALIPVYGVLGFWLYSVAMQRTTVALATTPVVTVETMLPAIVGVLWLGDQIRPGLTWVVAVGLALSMTGAIAVEQPHTAPERVLP